MDTNTSPLRLRCDREDLLAAITAADAVAPSNSAKPIITNLLFDAKQDSLEVIATDLQVGLRAVVKAVHVEIPGQAVVQARQLASILKESRSQTVDLHLDVRGDIHLLSIHLMDGDYQIPAVVGETFPPVQFFPADVPTITIKGQRFEEMLRQTAFGIDKDRTSAVLSGIFISIGNGELVLAATDGKVLCEAVEKNETFKLSDEAIQSVIPSITISHLQRILSTSSADTVTIALSEKLLFIRMTHAGNICIEITSRLVEGNFPSYRNALPMTTTMSVVFIASELSSAVRRAALMTSQSSRGIIMNLDRDQAVFANLNYTNGSARIPVGCSYAGSAMKLGINAQYLGDVLKVYKSEKIVIELSRGLIMREPGAIYLLMPITLPS